MATTVSNVQQALKYAYGVNKVQWLFNVESPTFNMLSKVKKQQGGRGQFIIPLYTKNAGAWSGIAEGGTLPTALAPATAEATFSLHEFTGMYDLSWKLISDARSDKFAFQQAVQFLGDGLKRRILRLMNADFIDNGKGRLAVLPAANNTTAQTSAFQPRLETGLTVDIMAVSDDSTARGSALTVSGMDPVAKTWTASGSPSSTAAGDYTVITGTVSGGTTSLHTHGLLDIVNSSNPATAVGNYGAINRSTAGNEYWKAAVLGNSGTNRPLSEDLLLQALDAVRINGGGKCDAIISNMPIVRRYHEILAGERYFALSKPGVLDGGIGRKVTSNDSGQNSDGEGLTPYEFSGIPWYVDPYFVNNTIVGLDTSHFFLGVGEAETPRPISEIFDNIPFFRQTNNATFQVAWYYVVEVLSDNPAAGFQVQDVAEA